MPERLKFGQKGEILAVEYLENKGYEILEKNWRYRHKEIDIIAKINSTLVIVEVKTRSSSYFQEPFMSVSRQKERHLIDAVEAFIQIRELDMEVRFDIISIVMHNSSYEIEHIEDAFYAKME